MRVLICGGRDFSDKDFIFSSLDKLHEKHHISHIITGGALGADFFAHKWASSRRCDITIFPANWKKYGKKAGALRNIQMLEDGEPELVIAFPGGKGTEHMKKIARKAGIEVVECGNG
jgi:hypothetical protein